MCVFHVNLPNRSIGIDLDVNIVNHIYFSLSCSNTKQILTVLVWDTQKYRPGWQKYRPSLLTTIYFYKQNHNFSTKLFNKAK